MDYIDRVDRIESILKEWHEAGRAAFESQYKNLDYDSESYAKTAKYKAKYIYLDDGNSGAFMVDRQTNRVYCIKAYGVPDKKKYVGQIDRITGHDLDYHRWWRLR